MKTCSKCGTVADEAAFRPSRAVCNPCRLAQRRDRYRKNAASEKAASLARYHKNSAKARVSMAAWAQANKARRAKYHRKSQLRRAYGLSVEDYQTMLEMQGDACGLCGKSAAEEGRQLSVDHCHRSGQVRALLCTCCNTGLGKFADSPALLRIAARYLEHFRD